MLSTLVLSTLATVPASAPTTTVEHAGFLRDARA
jgi:hypothetical protein